MNYACVYHQRNESTSLHGGQLLLTKDFQCNHDSYNNYLMGSLLSFFMRFFTKSLQDANLYSVMTCF